MESVFVNNPFVLEKNVCFLIVGVRVLYKSLRLSLFIMMFKITSESFDCLIYHLLRYSSTTWKYIIGKKKSDYSH